MMVELREYKSTLDDLVNNNKIVINLLTQLAQEHSAIAPGIAQIIENKLINATACQKLPVLYLIDSIVKNLKETSYLELFSKNIAFNFVLTFKQVDLSTRQALFKLRKTWSGIFENHILGPLDDQIRLIDPNWSFARNAIFGRETMDPCVGSVVSCEVSSNDFSLANKAIQVKNKPKTHKRADPRLERKVLSQKVSFPTNNPDAEPVRTGNCRHNNSIPILRNSCPTKDLGLKSNSTLPKPVYNNFNIGYNHRINNVKADPFQTSMNSTEQMNREYQSHTNRMQYFGAQKLDSQFREHQDFRGQNVPRNSTHPKSAYDSVYYQQNEAWSYHGDERSNLYWNQEYNDDVHEPPQQNLKTSQHSGLSRYGFRYHNGFACQSYERTELSSNNYRLNNHLLNMPLNFGVDRGVKRKLSNHENVPQGQSKQICRMTPNDLQPNPCNQARKLPSKPVTYAPTLTETVKIFESPPNSQIDVQQILSKLSAYGIIQNRKAGDVTSPPKTEKIVEKLSMMDFDPKKLRIKHKELIDKLYAGVCCSTCGLCFGEDEEARLRYKMHIEKHFQNNLKKADMAQRSREYFPSLGEWFSRHVISDTRRPLVEKVDKEDSHISTGRDKTIPDEMKELYEDKHSKGQIKKCSLSDPICNVCQEDFDDIWDAEEEEWVWKNLYVHDDKAFILFVSQTLKNAT